MKDFFEELLEKVAEDTSKGDSKKKQHYIELLQKGIKENRKLTAKDLGITQEIMDYLYAYGSRLYTSGNYKDASYVFLWLRRFDEQNFDYAFALASCYQMMKQTREAVVAFTVAFQLDLTNPLPNYHLSEIYRQEGRLGMCRLTLGLAIRQAGTNPKYAGLKERATLMKEQLDAQSSQKELQKQAK